MPNRSWSKLGVDVVGPIDGAPTSSRYAITLVGYSSKWVEVGLTDSVTTGSLIQFFDTLWAREGFPEELVSDNGPQFASQELEDYLQQRGIKHVFSSAYWPRENGAVERFNRTFKSWISRIPGGDSASAELI